MTRGSARWIRPGFLALAAVLVVVVALLPATVMLSTALKEEQDVFRSPATWLPDHVAWRNFVDVWSGARAADQTEIPFTTWFRNSLIVAVATTVVTLVVIVPAAFALAKMRFWGKQLFLVLLLAIQMFSPIIIIVPLFEIVRDLDLLDSFVALVLLNTVFAAAFSTWLLSGFFASVPVEVERAAWMDGCSPARTLLRIFVPLAAPGLVVTAIYVFIYAWNEFVFAYTMIISDDKRVFMVGLQTMLSATAVSSVQWHYLMTASIYSMLPVQLLFIFIRRFLVQGLMGGAVKQ